jgi:hypothetical protein
VGGRVRDKEAEILYHRRKQTTTSGNQQGEPESRTLNSELPPNIPDNDVQVQQFLTKQYHSHSEDGTLDPDK